MSAFYSLSDDEEDNQQPIAGPSSLTATPRRKQQADHASMLESPSASPFSRGSGAGAGAANAITPPPRHHGAYNARSSSPSAERRRPHPAAGPSLPALASAAAGPSTGPPPPLPAIERLQKVWVAERCSPELMAWTDPGAKYRCDDIVDDVCAQIEQQVSILNLLSSDESTSEEEHLRLSLVQLDVERARWLLRAFLRTRLAKIEEHAQYYLALSEEASQGAAAGAGGTTLLSPLEKAYALKYSSIRASHFTQSVLSYLPESLRSLTDSADDDSINSAANMVSRPDAAGPVFIRCVEDCGSLSMEDGETAQLVKGSVHLVRWERVKGLVRGGRAELV